MSPTLPFFIFLPMLSLKFALACLDGECRELSFPSFFFFADKSLVNHTIRIERVPDLDTCEFVCYQEPNCVSINFNIKASADGTFSCELNNATHRRHDDEFVDKAGYLYRGTESACDVAHCDNNGICQSGFTDKKYRCLCPIGFTGEQCEIDVNECATEEHSCSNDAVCYNTKGSYDCTCKPGYTGDGLYCAVPVAVALFPLNATYGTQEINNRTAQGIPNKVHLAPGPNGKADGSYEFFGTSDSYIEFPNTAEGPLDVRKSITMLCWLYHGGKDGPIFNYKNSDSFWGVHLYVLQGKLYVRFNKHDYSKTDALMHTHVAGGWKFVGASYDHGSGEAKLWVDGVVIQKKNIGVGLKLATQDRISMGVKSGDGNYFKGRIAQMQVYSESLTQGQIQTIQRQTLRVVDYIVTVVLKTADVKWASTGANITIRIQGTTGRLLKRKLLKGNFKRGSTDTFYFQDYEIGYVTRMDIKIHRQRNRWKPERVVIEIAGAPNSTFNYNSWVGAGWTTLNLSCPEGHHVNQQQYCSRARNCKEIKERGGSRGDGMYWLDPDEGSNYNEFPAYCDMTSDNGGWTMCYTTNEYAKPKYEVIYSDQSPYGSNGYRTNCNNIQFTEIMFIDHQTGNKAYFKGQDNLARTAAENYGNTGEAHGLWEGKGTDINYQYQMLICDDLFYSGFFVSGYTADCFKECHTWCGDTKSPYFRTASTSPSFKGVAFNTNGHRSIVKNRLISVGLR